MGLLALIEMSGYSVTFANGRSAKGRVGMARKQAVYKCYALGAAPYLGSSAVAP